MKIIKNEDVSFRENIGYQIKRSILFESGTGFVLGESPTNLAPFVTWKFNEENGKRNYYWGHYKTSLETATKDYENRIAEHQQQYKDSEKGAYKYYSTQRPVDIGTFPKTEANTPVRIVNFDVRESVESGNIRAWGFLIYDAPLTYEQIDKYELKAAPDNPDILEFEEIVTAAVCEELEPIMEAERKKPIAEQMKEGAEQAAEYNAARIVPDKKQNIDRG